MRGSTRGESRHHSPAIWQAVERTRAERRHRPATEGRLERVHDRAPLRHQQTQTLAAPQPVGTQRQQL